MDSSTPRSAPRGLSRDIHQIRQGSAATAAELREFISNCKGRRPAEVMGLITQSNLVQCTIIATIATVVFMAIFTIGPFVYNKLSPPVKATPVAAAPAAAPAKSTEPVATNEPAKAVAPATPATNDAPKSSAGKSSAPAKNDLAPPVAEPTISAADKQRAVEKLGVGETKAADPRKNPLENSSDDLLKDLK